MEIFSFYVGIIWYCFTGVLGIDLYRWKWLGIKSVVPSDTVKKSSALKSAGFIIKEHTK